MKISFKSTYKINQTQNLSSDFADKLYELYKAGVDMKENSTKDKLLTLVAPDKLDNEIESILMARGIDFHKTTKAQNLNLDNIKARMVLDPDFEDTHILVEIDSKRLDELLKLDNVSSIKESKYDEKFEKFHKYLETGLDINSPVIIFSNDVNGVFGVHIEDGRHRFAILRDMGMKKIPVAVSKDSLKYLKNFTLV